MLTLRAVSSWRLCAYDRDIRMRKCDYVAVQKDYDKRAEVDG